MLERRLGLGRCGRHDLVQVSQVIRVGVYCLESREPRVDSAPAGADEVDEKREVVDASMPLGEQVALESLEASDRLVEQPSDLGDVARDGKDFGAQPVPNRDADMRGDRCLELCRCRGESLDLVARAVEGSCDVRRRRASRGRVRDPLLRSFQRESVHRRRGYPPRRMDTAELDYDLPAELIAQHPAERRDDSRLLVYRKEAGEIEHRRFSELPDLVENRLVVVNDTKVVPARLALRRETGGAVEVLLVESLGDGRWEALVRPSRKLRPGDRLGPVSAIENLGAGRWVVELEGEPNGSVPLPPYIHEALEEADRYQTVYAEVLGSAAAPTAGLHFTSELVRRLDPARVTLHVGLDTFRPVTEQRLEDHELHGERYTVTAGAWERIDAAERVLAVGTTTVRVLETVARGGELTGRTSLFVMPGHVFRRVDALLTNFHLPRSTLLALVMAFAGVDETRAIYREAIAERYRFYSFGDAMVVL